MELFEFGLAELHTHLIDFLESNTMLARDRAADPNAQLQNLGAQRLGALKLAGFSRVIQDERVQVAIPRMKNVSHPQPGSGREFGDA